MIYNSNLTVVFKRNKFLLVKYHILVLFVSCVR